MTGNTTTCPKCHDTVANGDWHHSCFLAVLGVIMVRRYG